MRTPVTCQWCKQVVHRRYVRVKSLGFKIVPRHIDPQSGKTCRGSDYPCLEFYKKAVQA